MQCIPDIQVENSVYERPGYLSEQEPGNVFWLGTIVFRDEKSTYRDRKEYIGKDHDSGKPIAGLDFNNKAVATGKYR